jgi:uncharacterized Zn finger protein
MTINDFEKHIDPVILERGFSYYEHDAVQEVEQVDKYEYSAAVSGSDEYEVYIKLDSAGNLAASTCDCPYDWGNFCKHEVAVLYYIKDAEMHLGKMDESGNLPQIRTELHKMDKKMLEGVIIGMAKRSRKVREEIMWELGLEMEE